jgi:hypothetical protein
MNSNYTLTLSKEEMKNYGYKVIDIIVEHFETQNSKNPVTLATREEMDSLFLENAPEKGTAPNDVLDFVVEKVLKVILFLTQSHILLFQGQVTI